MYQSIDCLHCIDLSIIYLAGVGFKDMLDLQKVRLISTTTFL